MSDEESLEFERKGAMLWRQLKQELLDEYVVYYQGDGYKGKFAREDQLPEELRAVVDD